MNDNTSWRVASIRIDFKSYGENKGKYEGKITFDNGDFESFAFKLRPDMAEAYIKLLSQDIVRDASCLGERLLTSLGLRAAHPAPAAPAVTKEAGV